MAAVLAAFQSLRYLLVAKRFRPKWMRQFVDEEPVKEDDIGQKSDKIVWIWSFLLAALSLLAAASQVAKLIRLSNLRLPSSLLLAAWILNGLVVSLLRPRYCPTHLVPFYILALVPEAAGIGLAPELPTLHEGLHSFALLATLLSLLVLLLMRFRPRSPGSGPIGGVGRTPQQSERSPEDALRLWQFITVAWIGPILSLGKKRKLEKEDVWSLPYEFETARLARAFRELQGSVLRRLLRANRVDICVLILTAFIRLFCGRFIHLINPERVADANARLGRLSVPARASPCHGESKSNYARCDYLCYSSLGSPNHRSTEFDAVPVVRKTVL